ncbi:7607_t:CDS:2, partial [Acaulospora colombiana]
KLDNLVNSGTMKIVDERKTLQEISSLRRLRKTVESFQAEQDEIEKDRKAIDELRAVLDDPEMKAVSEKYDQIKGELDELKKESDAAYEGRSKLFDQRTELQGKLDDVWARKKAAQADYKAGTDSYWKKAVAQEMLEQAKEPAYAADIQDCQTLIDFFTRLSGGNASTAEGAAVSLKYGASTAPKLELRQGGDSMEGMTALKKKGEEENNYFVAKKTKKAAPAKSYGSPAPAPPQPTGETSNASSQQLNIPFGTLSGLMALSIPPPTNVSEVSRVIEDLKTKKAWFQANQDR